MAHGLRAARQEEHPPEQLRDLFNAPGRLLLFELEDLVPDGLGQLQSRPAAILALQSRLALEPVTGDPLVNGGAADAQFPGDHLLGEAFFQVEFDGPQPLLEREAMSRNFWRSAPRGGGVVPLLLYWFVLLHADTFYH